MSLDRRQFIGSMGVVISLPTLAASWVSPAAPALTAASAATSASPNEALWRIEGWSARDDTAEDAVWIRFNSSGQCAWR